jgi:hypothetical protein
MLTADRREKDENPRKREGPLDGASRIRTGDLLGAIRATNSLEPEEIAAAVVDFIRDEEHSGRVMIMWPGEPPRLLDPQIRP